jgi:hypothetical protein
MSNEHDDESADSQQESEQQPVDSDQTIAQSEEQSTEQTDQSTQQSDQEPVDGDQPADQSQEQPAEADQAVVKAEEQPSGIDESVEQVDQSGKADQTAEQPADANQAATSEGEDDAVALGGGHGDTAKTSAHNVRVIAEFTEGGEKFLGEIKLLLFAYNNTGVSTQLWDQGRWQAAVVSGNVITTPMVRFTTSQLAITADARVFFGAGSYQVMGGEFVFPVPSGDTLRTKFDVGVAKVDETVTAPDVDIAKGKVFQMPKFRGKFVSLNAQSAGNQQFHVKGKYNTRTITSFDGRQL